jgi:hypothetical protein
MDDLQATVYGARASVTPTLASAAQAADCRLTEVHGNVFEELLAWRVSIDAARGPWLYFG